jgi:hypothetical protein
MQYVLLWHLQAGAAANKATEGLLSLGPHTKPEGSKSAGQDNETGRSV